MNFKHLWCKWFGCITVGKVTGLPQAHCSRCGYCNYMCGIHNPKNRPPWTKRKAD